MPYFAVDDGMYDHPKFDGLSDAAVALWTKAGSWCARYLKDGEVPADRVLKLGYQSSVADELVRAGLWTGVHGGFRFHQWSQHQFSKADVEKKRERWRDEKRRRREAKSKGKPGMSGVDSGVESGSDSACPIPSHPIPIKKEESAPDGAASCASQVKGPRAPRKPDEAKTALQAALKVSFEATGDVAPDVTGKPAEGAAKRLREAVRLGHAPDLASAAERLVSACRRLPAERWPWCLTSAPLAAPQSSVRGDQSYMLRLP